MVGRRNPGILCSAALRAATNSPRLAYVAASGPRLANFAPRGERSRQRARWAELRPESGIGQEVRGAKKWPRDRS